jgi:hypothetical protein
MRCPSCDTPNPPEATRCEECGAALKPRPASRRPESEAIEERPARRRPDEERPEAPRVRRRRPADEEDDEYEDDRPSRRRRPSDGEEVVSTLIPYKNPRALAGYYTSIFGLLPFLGVILAPIALFLGISGLRYVRRHPDAHGTAHAIVAVVLGSISLLYNLPLTIFVLLGVLGAFK